MYTFPATEEFLSMQSIRNYLGYAISISFIVFILWVIYSANTSSLPEELRRLARFPGGDKVAHFLLIATLTLLVNNLLWRKMWRIYRWSIHAGTLLIAILVFAEEVTQLFIASRQFDWYDLSADFFGILVAEIFSRWRRRK
jgi:VanZ family protein